MNEQEIIDYWLNMRQQPIQLVSQDAFWQQVRIQAAIAAMNIVKGAYNIHDDIEQLVQHSVRIADALIQELKGGEE